MHFPFPDHTMLPIDSIQATIEPFIRRRVVLCCSCMQSEWPSIIFNARTQSQNYEIILMSHEEFSDLKSLAVAYIPSKYKNNFGELPKASFKRLIKYCTCIWFLYCIRIDM